MEIENLLPKYNCEFMQRLYKHRHIFYEIFNECGNKFIKGCGSYLFDGQNYKYCEEMFEKQLLLYNCAKNATKVLEIGVYMGHSILIMLLANPNLKITCIDIDHTFSGPAVKVLNRYFNNAVTFIHNDSLKVLKTLDGKYDFFHVDGYHDNDYIRSEFNYIKNLNESTDKVLKILFDDQECLPALQKEIENNCKVLKKIIPNCPWNNVYYELTF